MAVLHAVSESTHGTSLDAILFNSDQNYLSYLSRTDGQTKANAILPLPHRVRAGDKNMLFVSIFLPAPLQQRCLSLFRVVK